MDVRHAYPVRTVVLVKYLAPHWIGLFREKQRKISKVLSMNDAGNLHSRPSTEEVFIRVSGAPRAVGIMVFGKFSWLYFSHRRKVGIWGFGFLLS
jgi:hypothetical protein